MSLRLPSFLILLPLLWGCVAGNPYAPVPKHLALTTQTYADVVRWGDLHRIHTFGPPDAGWTAQQNLDNVRVTGYEATTPNEIGPWLWGATAVIDYVLVDRQVVRRLVDQQRWTSDDEGRTWYRTEPPPRF